MHTKHSLYVSAPLLALVIGASVIACSDGNDSADSNTTSDASSDAKVSSSIDSSTSGDDTSADSSTTTEDASGGDDDANTQGDSGLADTGADSGTCGDGTKNGAEACDLGTAMNTGAYGGCKSDCTLADYCGDGTKNGTEGCDLGTAMNTGAYGGCKSDCTLADYCGDGTKNGTEGRDLGTAMNTGAYGGCKSDCTLADYCGDGTTNGTEACDLGAGKNGLMTTCAADCSAATTLLLHVDASNPNGNGTLPADGTAMGAWVDLANGTSVVQSTGTKQPVWTASAIANKPAFLFDGVDDFLDVTLDINGATRANLTVIAVFQNNTGNNGSYSGVWGHDNGGWDRFMASGGSAGGNGVSNGGGFTVVTGLTTKSVPIVSSTVLVSNSANASKSYVNGTLGATFTGSIQPGGNHMAIGSIQTPPAATGYSMHGYIAEVLIYNSALSDADRMAIETALITKYTP